MIKVGMKAPELNLYDSEKSLVKLDDYRDKKNVVLLFFPLAFTSTCTRELCSVRDNLPLYQNDQCTAFAISVDSVYTLAAYKEMYQLPYGLLSDFNREASKAYMVLYDVFTS